MDIAPALPSVTITVQQVWTVRLADPTAIRHTSRSQPDRLAAPNPAERIATTTSAVPAPLESPFDAPLMVASIAAPARVAVAAAPLAATTGDKSPTPLSQAAKTSIAHGEVPADLLASLDRLVADQDRDPQPGVTPTSDTGVIPGTTPPLTLGQPIASSLLAVPDIHTRPEPTLLPNADADATLFATPDPVDAMLGPDRAPGSVLFPVLLLIALIAAALLALALTGFWL